MARSYEEIIAARRARLAPGAEADRAVFEQAYDVAMQVVELREKHGLTQAQLADRSGIDQGDISRIERGATSPTARTLQRIADALGADVRLVERASTVLDESLDRIEKRPKGQLTARQATEALQAERAGRTASGRTPAVRRAR
jgi:transcriptional regulator with XRE-family HTH domain